MFLIKTILKWLIIYLAFAIPFAMIIGSVLREKYKNHPSGIVK